MRILRQNVRNQNLICEDFEDGVGWYDPHLLACLSYKFRLFFHYFRSQSSARKILLLYHHC